MYPQAELTELARGKAARRQSIARHRVHCAATVTTVVLPLTWLDTASSMWRRFGPLAQLATWPLGAAVARSVLPGGKTVNTVLRWVPAVIGAVSAFRRFRSQSKIRSGTSS